jgi:hypothetical protein
MRVLGLLIATGGGVAIGFGWAGAAQESCVDCQIPYLLSGGAAGVGLIIFGIALLLLAQIRTESRRLGDRIEHALGVRPRPEQAHRPAATPAAEPAMTEQPTAISAMTERRDEALTTGASEVRRPEQAALASPEPAPNPLSAVRVDAPTEPDAQRSDAATLAATTAAGGVVDTTEGERGAGGDSSKSEETTSFPHSGDESTAVPPSPADAAPEFVTEPSAPNRWRGLFRRRKGP